MSSDQPSSSLSARYVIERELGRGGMGTVYLARDVGLDRPVALKVLPADYASQHDLRERFVRETRTAAGFSHPNIVPVYSVEETDDVLAYAMAYVEGETLTDRVMRAGPLPVRDVVRLLTDVAYALAYAHGRGVVHRDVKPDNVMIERATGRALVMDFGIARTIAAPDVRPAEGLTRVGEVVGTPEYMSPEQATGDHVDGRSDLYALGLTAFFALAGRPAVMAETTGKVLAQQITTPLPDLRADRPDVPAPLMEAVERCAAKDPADRYQSAEQLVEALDAARLSAPEIPLPVRLFAQELGTLSIVLVFGGLLVFFMTAAQQAFGDVVLLVVLLSSVLLTRIMQTSREAGRLATSGFSPADVEKGMEAVLAERATRREELKADPVTQFARKRTLAWATVLLVGGGALFRWAMTFRFEIAPGRHNVRPPGGLMVMAALIMLGIGLALLMRSPFRAPIGERLFRLVWLGPIGRWFVRFAARGALRRARETRSVFYAELRPAAPVRKDATPANAVKPATTATLDTRLDTLERRVAALEQSNASRRPSGRV